MLTCLALIAGMVSTSTAVTAALTSPTMASSSACVKAKHRADYTCANQAPLIRHAVCLQPCAALHQQQHTCWRMTSACTFHFRAEQWVSLSSCCNLSSTGCNAATMMQRCRLCCCLTGAACNARGTHHVSVIQETLKLSINVAPGHVGSWVYAWWKFGIVGLPTELEQLLVQ